MPRARVAEVLERVGRLGLETLEHRAELLLVLADERGGQTLLHGERDELLLRPVVDVALELLRALVLGGDDPPAGGAELLDEADVP
jgi:hypothetical protein